MLFRALMVLITAAAFVASSASADMSATTSEGKKVILHDDGKWEYADQTPTKAVATSDQYVKSPSATQKIELLKGKASLNYDPAKWQDLKETEPGRFELNHKDGDAYAVVISERLEISQEALQNLALKNAKEFANDAHVVAQQKRRVNGVELLFMQIAGTTEGIAFAYLGYYYTGKSGSVQVVTFTGQNLLDEYRKDMEGFLNGFQVEK
jgi:hypothetical protein